jgi:hypothetical protein
MLLVWSKNSLPGMNRGRSFLMLELVNFSGFSIPSLLSGSLNEPESRNLTIFPFSYF